MKSLLFATAALALLWCGSARAECTQSSSPQSCYTDGLQQIMQALAQIKEVAAEQDGKAKALSEQIEKLRADVEKMSTTLATSPGQFGWLEGLWCADNGYKVSRSIEGNILIERIQALPPPPRGVRPRPPRSTMRPHVFMLISMGSDPVIVPAMVRFHFDGTTLRFMIPDGSPLPGSIPEKHCN